MSIVAHPLFLVVFVAWVVGWRLTAHLVRWMRGKGMKPFAWFADEWLLAFLLWWAVAAFILAGALSAILLLVTRGLSGAMNRRAGKKEVDHK